MKRDRPEGIQNVTYRVAITQPYVPEYRFPLWQKVIDNLAEANVEGHVFYGGDAEQLAIRKARGDGVDAPWATQVRTRTIHPTAKFPKLVWRSIPRGWRPRGSILVTEMQASNLNAWAAMALRRPYITLGHGSSGTTKERGLADALESILNRSATHALTYTETGRDHVIRSARLTGGQVTAFRNSTDSLALKTSLDSVREVDQLEFRADRGIPAGAPIALFIGALNEHKNLDLLIAATRIVLGEHPEWWVLVAGDGPEAWKIEQLCREQSHVLMLGQVNLSALAIPASMGSVLLNPGRVGLVAVDALVMGLPIITSNAAAHAPEFEYLRPGIDVLEVHADPSSFAAAWVAAAGSRVSTHPDIPSIEGAAISIASVILAELERIKK